MGPDSLTAVISRSVGTGWKDESHEDGPRISSHSCCLLIFWSMTYFHFLFLLLLFQDLPPAVCLPPQSALVSLSNTHCCVPGLPPLLGLRASSLQGLLSLTSYLLGFQVPFPSGTLCKHSQPHSPLPSSSMGFRPLRPAFQSTSRCLSAGLAARFTLRCLQHSSCPAAQESQAAAAHL